MAPDSCLHDHDPNVTCQYCNDDRTEEATILEEMRRTADFLEYKVMWRKYRTNIAKAKLQKLSSNHAAVDTVHEMTNDKKLRRYMAGIEDPNCQRPPRLD